MFAGLLLAWLSDARAATSVTLAWDPSTDPTVVGYILYYGNYSENFSQSINVGGATSATVTNLTPGQTYYFVATAYNAAGIQSAPRTRLCFNFQPQGSPPIHRDQQLVQPLFFLTQEISMATASRTFSGETCKRAKLTFGTWTARQSYPKTA